jgi:hypothetical protein
MKSRFLREKRNDFAVTKNEKAPPEIAPAADLTRRQSILPACAAPGIPLSLTHAARGRSELT